MSGAGGAGDSSAAAGPAAGSVAAFLERMQRDINCLGDAKKPTRKRALTKLARELQLEDASGASAVASSASSLAPDVLQVRVRAATHRPNYPSRWALPAWLSNPALFAVALVCCQLWSATVAPVLEQHSCFLLHIHAIRANTRCPRA